MNIHYFTSRSFSAEDLDKIKIGDICIINESGQLSVCIANTQLSSLELESNFVEIIYSKNITGNLSIKETTIFGFDGVRKRYGNKHSLQILINLLDNESIQHFLQECLAILDFKEDRLTSKSIIGICGKPLGKLEIDIKLKDHSIVKEHNSSIDLKGNLIPGKNPIQEVPIHNTISLAVTNQPEDYVFYDFLDKKEQQEWLNLTLQQIPLRNIYYKIKSLNKVNFRSALRNFNKKFPQLTIYSLKPDTKKNSDCRNTNDIPKDFNFIYEGLIQRGFSHVADDIWETKENVRYVVSIKKL